MDPSCRWPVMRCSRFPRPREDGPKSDMKTYLDRLVSPPTRGWTHRRSVRDGSRRGFIPAHAGMDLISAIAASATPRFPRPRGDGPVQRTTPSMPPPASATPRFPRPRGDGPPVGDLYYRALLVSPPTRGWTTRAPHPGNRGPGSPPTRGWTADRAGRQHRALGTRQSITSCKCQHSRSRSIASRPSARVRRTWRHGGRLDRVGRDAGLDQPQGLPLPAGNVRPLGALRAA